MRHGPSHAWMIDRKKVLRCLDHGLNIFFCFKSDIPRSAMLIQR